MKGSTYKQKDKDGKPGSIWWIQWYRDGKRYRESSGSERKTDAQAQLARRLGDVSRGLPVSPRYDRLTFDEAARDVVTNYQLKGQSIDGLERRLRKHLTPYFGGTRLVDITTAKAANYAVHRQSQLIVTKARKGRPESSRKVSDAEINRELAILKRIFSLAVKGGKLLHRPYIEMLRENNVRSGFFEPEQFAAMLSRLPEPLQPVIEFAYVTGWRVNSEILPLEWGQINFANAGEVRLNKGTTKNRDGRVFPMNAQLRAILLAQVERRDALRREKGRICPWVFHRDGDQIKSFKKAFATACRLAGCPGRIPHDLRRTAVRNMIDAGIPEGAAMRLTGHKTRSVFDRYNIISDGNLLAASLKLDQNSNSHKTAMISLADRQG